MFFDQAEKTVASLTISVMFSLSIALLGFQALVTTATCKHVLDSCPIKVEPLGCFKDRFYDRALKHEVLNARQSDRHIYAGYMIDWNNWSSYLPKFICDCAKVAFRKGYKVMGVQFFGECWGSLQGHLEYAKHGKIESCVHSGRREPWGICQKNDLACIGEALTNFVYRIAPPECDTYYEPVGCYRDNQTAPRPLPEYVMNERDYSTSNWNGHLIDWKKWNTYSPKMICRCAAKAKALGKTTFGVQFYGECWTGDDSRIQYARDGFTKRCLAKDFLQCPYNSYHCVGMDHANMVYQLIPSTS